MLKKNNKGISYVEMILVIAIMAIVTGLVSISIGLVNGTNVSRASEVTCSALQEARNSALTKGSDNGYVSFMLRKGACYYYVGKKVTISTSNDSDVNWTKICNGTVDVFFSQDAPDSDSLGNKLTGGNVYGAKFSQSSGSLSNETNYNFQYITFVHGDKQTTVRIFPVSGKAEIL